MALLQTLKFITTHPLTRKNRLQSVLRFLKWQLSCITSPYPIVYPFINNTYLVVEKGMTGATGNIYTGLHEFSDMGFLLHFLRKDDHFFDIGANVGSYTVLASGVCQAKTISFEPSSETYKKLIRNIKINQLEESVNALNIGLGAKIGVSKFTRSLDTVNHIVEKGEEGISTESIKIDTLDNIQVPISRATLIKIDVEGFETEVLKGATETLNNSNIKSIIIELNGSGIRYGYNEENVHSFLLSLGFNPYSYNPLRRKLTKEQTYSKLNTIYIRDLEFVKERITNSIKITVLKTTF